MEDTLNRRRLPHRAGWKTVGRSCAALLTVLAACLAARGEDWPRWGGPRGDGSWQAPKLPDAWPNGKLPVKWKKPIGGGYGGITVVDGRGFVMDRQTEPREVERVLCFDVRDGSLLWHHDYPVAYGKLDYGNGPRATPTNHAGKVYTLGAMGHAWCLDAATGKPVWSRDLVAEAGAKIPMWGLAASPVIWNEIVFLHPGAENGCVMALERTTGKEIWRTSTDPAGYATPIVIEAPSGPQLVAWTPLHILGINPATGKEYWSVPYEITYGVSIATPIYRNATVFVTAYWAGSKAIRLGKKPDQAELIWEENRNLRGLMAQPLYRDGYVYTIDKDRGLTCFEFATSRKLWDDGHKLVPRGHNPQGTLVWLGDGDRAILLNDEGDLILARLNPSGCHEQSRTNIIERKERAPIWAHPAYAGNCVYARSDSDLVCVELVPQK
ncbi:MAG: PQQ-like beta-propeller repeat protein [Planctomycetia bacterium]|nr:PQQ-like beta-propeller repeat protein [Planctomycetia bacterium]